MADRGPRIPRDVVDTVLGFARTLRSAGVTASPDRVEAMLAALGSLDVLDPSDVYWAGRLTLCGGPDDLDRYDAAFAAYFAGEAPRAARPPERSRPSSCGRRRPGRSRRLPGEPGREGGVVAVQIVRARAEGQPAGPVDVGRVEHVERRDCRQHGLDPVR